MMNLKFVLWEYISIGKMKMLEMAERVSLNRLFFFFFFVLTRVWGGFDL